MSYKVFIDGSSGTTGLRIADRLAGRPELELLSIPEESRKDLHKRAETINAADLAFLCLPDAASKEVIPLVEPHVRVLDTSTAFRTAPGWVYGFPELHGQREKIRQANRVAVPGCHASGFICLARPLVELGLVPADYPFTCHSLTGYSGGGKKMIAEYEAEERAAALDSPRQYALGQAHKHLPEMQAVCGLSQAPVFSPIVADYYSGMCVTVPLITRFLNKRYTVSCLKEYFTEYYAGQKLIQTAECESGYLAANELSGTDGMRIFVAGNDERILLCSVFDNLGKGASGAAVQCMNLMLGIDECTSLTV